MGPLHCGTHSGPHTSIFFPLRIKDSFCATTWHRAYLSWHFVNVEASWRDTQSTPDYWRISIPQAYSVSIPALKSRAFPPTTLQWATARELSARPGHLEFARTVHLWLTSSDWKDWEMARYDSHRVMFAWLRASVDMAMARKEGVSTDAGSRWLSLDASGGLSRIHRSVRHSFPAGPSDSNLFSDRRLAFRGR